MNQELVRFNPEQAWADPAEIGWPPTLAIEIAMHAQPVREICEAYEIDRPRWDEIRANPIFVSEVTSAMEMLRQDGASFKVRARMMSGELLKEMWRIIHHHETSLAVKTDLIKFLIRIAGLDASKEQGSLLGKLGSGNGGFALNIVMGDNNTVIGG